MDHLILAERLKELREEHHYSQRYIAEQLNISRQTYSHYETGRINPPTDSLYALAEIYHISMDALFPTTSAKSASRTPSFDYLARTSAELSEYQNYIQINEARLQNLTHAEKKLIYYFNRLDDRDQREAIDIMRLKDYLRKNRKHKSSQRD